MIERHEGGIPFKGEHPARDQCRREFDTPDASDRQIRDILGLVTDRMRLENAALDIALEKMMTDPLRRGLLRVGGGVEPISLDEPMPDILSVRYEYVLDQDVPFGQILSAPSWEAVERWRAYGSPL